MMTDGPLGKKIEPPKKPEPPEKWIPCEHNPDYVRSTKTGAVKRKGD
jgi:hypothetical protein